MKSKVILALLLVLPVLGGCSGAKISSAIRTEYLGPPISSIALAPGGGAFADAVGVELFNKGMTVVDPEQTMGILGRVGLSEIQVASPAGYSALREAGVDALLVVKAVMSGDGTPESASIRLTGTATSEIVAGLTWQNGWGGQRGSWADRTMRKNLTEAASQIAKGLLSRLE